MSYDYYRIILQEYLWGWVNGDESQAISWCENYPDIYEPGTLSLWTTTQRQLRIDRGFSDTPDYVRETEYSYWGKNLGPPPSATPIILDSSVDLQVSNYVDASGFSSWDWCCNFVRYYEMYYTVYIPDGHTIDPRLIFDPWNPTSGNGNESQDNLLSQFVTGIRLRRL